MLTFSHQAQLADLGVALATSFAGMAMSTAFAATAVAFSLPLAFANVSHVRGPRFAIVPAPLRAPQASTPEPYASYRSDGGHATTLVLMQQPLPGA